MNVAHSTGTPRQPASPLPTLVAGEIHHRRTRPAANEFHYPGFCLRLPLSALDRLPDSGIAFNRRGLVSFHERDHGPRDGSSLDAWIRSILRREGVAFSGDIDLYVFPRMLGYVFNPVSFWVCRQAGSGDVAAVLVEVNNTFGERHQYLLSHADGRPLASGETLEARKAFHVSPFCEVRGRYRFRFHFGPGRWLARIDYFDGGEALAAPGVPLLETSVSGREQALAPGAGRALVARYRWFTLGVIVRIHLQALRLWTKRVPFFTKPAPPALPLTRNTR